MNILTDEELSDIESKVLQSGKDYFEVLRAIEAEVAKTLRKQIIEEICFKMTAGSPNRERIHRLIDGWML